MPAVNNIFGQGVNFVRNINITNPTNLKGLKYIPEAADKVTLSTKKLSEEDIRKWKNAVTEILRNDYKGLDSTKNMSEADRIELGNVTRKTRDEEPFLLMSTGGRPAMSMKMDPVLTKINSPEYRVLPDRRNNFDNAFIFNKKAMLENIDKNKVFYTKRLNLPPDTSNQKIYQILTCSESPINTRERKDCQDIIGVMFDYPVKNTIIFQLERDAGLGPELRSNITKYKTEVKKVLNSKDSRYASFGEDFKRDIEKTVDSIESISSTRGKEYPDGYIFIKFIDEPIEECRIGKQVRNSTAELERLNKTEEERRFARDLDELENMNGSQGQYFDFLRDLVDKYGMNSK